ncbi:hypothetical protein RA29_17910 [Tateyamaria sp. ANG-S1]|nr:hypothetical protein RA29_17910 [Tateyamaria sp. ANG-S1]
MLFTCDPLTGDPSQVRIEAAYGACRQVVDGYAMVKTVVDRLTGARMVSGEDGRILPPRRIDALLEVALRHDAEFGLRHDIEFAFADDTRTGEEYLTLLQSRPVTTPLVQPS